MSVAEDRHNLLVDAVWVAVQSVSPRVGPGNQQEAVDVLVDTLSGILDLPPIDPDDVDPADSTAADPVDTSRVLAQRLLSGPITELGRSISAALTNAATLKAQYQTLAAAIDKAEESRLQLLAAARVLDPTIFTTSEETTPDA